MSRVMMESALVGMSDEELIKFIGALFETIKRNTEAAKVDEELIEMKQAVKDHEYEKYGREVKVAALRLKGAREQAKVRGLVFKLPEGVYENK